MPEPQIVPAFTLGKLFVGVLCQPDADILAILSDLCEIYGDITPLGELGPTFFSFEHTDYYTPEMGPHLRRFFVSVDALYDPEYLADAKHKSVALEKKYTNIRGRKVNLDPGILFLHNLILLSTKNFAHRIPLSGGIYGEVTLLYQQKKWESLPWSFPDYKGADYQSLFTELRRVYRKQLETYSLEGLLQNAPCGVSTRQENPHLRSVNSGFSDSKSLPDTFCNSPLDKISSERKM